ncbi:MAG TPA: magnesium-translocating P-type ATPase [Candidatus Eisenbacteria bacterium]|nr:magnesium-translocating P-type ATPase [Candidatus Eisenbacteria bacterium]
MSEGLSEREVQERLSRYGKNVLAEKSRFFLFKELFKSFFSPLILLLLGASLISAFLGDIPNFVIIFTIVVASGLISFFQHYKAENAANRLKSKVTLTATVIRDGEQKEIPFTHITIDDVVILSAGDLVPADCQLLETNELSVDESSLTGESYPVEKHIKTSGEGNHTTSVFAGTHIVSGQAKGVVIAIGRNTQIGKLSEKIIQQKPQTEFDKELNSFSMLILRLVLVLALFVFGVNALFHHNFFSSFLFAVALAVGLAPELMPVIISVSLSRGAIKMEEKEVIVKFLPGIQNLGSMDILCMDKTGTITENNITLSSFEDANAEKNDSILFLAKLNSHFQSGFKNPLDHAVLSYLSPLETKGRTKVDEIPFDFERKKLSIILKDTKNSYQLITKGAPQKILENVSHFEKGGKIVKISSHQLSTLKKRAEELAHKGFRVIALAQKEIEKKESYSPSDEKNLVFSGYLIFIDPVKKTVAETLKKLLSLGIESKILTGDNALVAEKSCKDAGIPTTTILTGEEIEKFSDKQLQEKVEDVTIFAQLDPEQKARIIVALKNLNHVVGFLGDGINDAPPLKAADIGISVHNGSDIAKDVADIILMRKSLTVLVAGVLEGRKTYANTFKYIMMSLSSNFGNMMSVAIASIFLPFLPLLPVQILLIDFLYDLSQVAVPSDNVDESAVRKPKEWSIGFLKRFTFVFGPLSSLFDLIAFSVLLFFLHASIPAFRTGWFVESFITQTIIIFAIRTHFVPFFKSKPSKYLIMSALITIGAGALIVFTSFGKYFAFTALPAIFWIILIAEIIFYFTCVELTKLFFYKKYSL